MRESRGKFTRIGSACYNYTDYYIYEMATERRKILWTGIKNITVIGIMVLVSYCLAVKYKVSI